MSGLGSLATKSTVASADITDLTVATGDLANDAVTYAKLQNISANNRVLGLITGAPGDAIELTGTQVTAMLDAATATVKGLVPTPPNNTTTFLRGDATFAAPAAPAAGSITPAMLQSTDFGAFTVAAGVATLDNDAVETADITAKAVTYPKIQDVTATNRVLGRITAGAGVVEELTGANVSTILGLTGLATAAIPLTVPNGGTGATTLTGIIRGTGTGALTASATVGTTEIANDAVTYAKIQNVTASDRLLGRSTAGAGDVEEITCTAAGRTLIAGADATAQRTSLGLTGLATATTVAGINAVTTDDDVATVTAVAAKANSASPTFTGTVTLPATTTIDAFTGVLRADTGVVSVDTDVTDIVSTFTSTVKGAVPPPTTVTGKFLKDDGTWALPTATGGARLTQIYTVPGPLVPGTGTTEFVLTLPGDVVNVWTSVTNTFTGSSLICDVNINGSTIFATQANRPTIAAGNRRDTTATPDTGAFVAGDRITVDIDQTGTHAAADQVTIGVEYTYD